MPWEPPTLLDLLANGRSRGAVAILTAERTVSYPDLWAEAERWSQAIIAAVPAGRPVAVLVEEPARFVAAAIGVWLAGCPLVPLEPGRHESEVVGALSESGAGLLVSDPSRRLAEAGLDLHVLHEPAAARGRSRPVGPDDAALLLHTSGTTGTAKCVVFSHQAMTRNVRAFVDAAGLVAEDRFLTPLAPSLTTALASCVLPALALGTEAVLPGRLSPRHTLRVLQERRTTVLLAVPYVYHLLADLPPEPLSLPSLRRLITNSAPMAPAIAEAIERKLGLLPRSNYCSSEAGGVTFNGAVDRRLLLESVGTALPGVRLDIVDHDGRSLRQGEEGRIVVHSSMTASGYLGRPELTARVFREGAVWTDDIGAVSPHGYLRLTGRLSDLVNIAGHLVNPAEIEAVLVEHPAVAEALVRSEDDEAAGQRLAALVVPAGDLDVTDLRRFCFDRLASHKVPRRVDVVAALPRTATGKVQRRAVV